MGSFMRPTACWKLRRDVVLLWSVVFGPLPAQRSSCYPRFGFRLTLSGPTFLASTASFTS